MSEARGVLVPLMFTAIENKYSFNSFYRSARSKGVSYRRADMLSDWHDVQEMVIRKAALAELKSGEYPELTVVSESRWEWNEPFVYQARVVSQISRAVLPESRFVTVLSEEPLTKGEIEEQIRGKWFSKWEYGTGKITAIQPVAAIHWIGE